MLEGAGRDIVVGCSEERGGGAERSKTVRQSTIAEASVAVGEYSNRAERSNRTRYGGLGDKAGRITAVGQRGRDDINKVSSI